MVAQFTAVYVKHGKWYIGFVEEGRFQKVLPLYSKKLMKVIVKKGIKERILVKEGVKAIKSKNSEFRYVSKEFVYPSSTVVCGNKTGIIIWSEPFYTIVIENKEVADSFRSYFEILWKVAKKK